MHRLAALAISSAIFFTAMAAVTLIAFAPYGAIYATLIGEASGGTAEITVSGLTKPMVDLTVGTKRGGQYITLELSDTKQSTALLTIPAAWHLEEVRGVHASDLVRDHSGERQTLLFALTRKSAELRFTTAAPFEHITFQHDAMGPGLFAITEVSLDTEEVERMVKVVKRGEEFVL